MTKIIVDELGFCVYKTGTEGLQPEQVQQVCLLAANFVKPVHQEKEHGQCLDNLIHDQVWTILTPSHKLEITRTSFSGRSGLAQVTIGTNTTRNVQADHPHSMS